MTPTIRIVDTTIREPRAAPAWVARLWWPALLGALLVSMFHHINDGDPSIRFATPMDLVAFVALVVALTLEARAAVVWLIKRALR